MFFATIFFVFSILEVNIYLQKFVCLISTFFVHIFFAISIIIVLKWQMRFNVIIILPLIIQIILKCFENVLIK